MTPIELDSSALKSSIAFTGRLACMTRAEAFEVVRQRGGTPSETVTKQTKLLIVGELGWPLLDDGRPSNKLSRATAYGVPIVSERRFLEWIGKAIPDNLHKTYSADQLAALSKLPSDKIQELVHLGLLDERDGHFGFHDLAGARQIAKLLTEGVRLSEIIRSVSEIKKWLLRLDWPMYGCTPDLTTASKSSSLGDAPTGMASLCLQSLTVITIPMICSSRHGRQRKAATRRSLKFCEMQVHLVASA
jgi:hypothetical protein